jgi:hypothetical protein
LALLLTFSVASASAAQVVEGRVAHGTGEPIDGALVVLLDLAGARKAGTLTDAAGRFRIVAPAAGEYRIQAERIGYSTELSAPFNLRPGQTLHHALAVSLRPVTLEGIVVQGENRCTKRPAGGLATHRVWEEARKALHAAAWTQESGLVRYRIRRYNRDLDPRARRVTREDARVRSGVGERPFESLSAELLVGRGFVQQTDSGRMYYAPDAEVLLSDAFLDTHCFQLVVDLRERADQIGLSFDPIRGRGVPDIAGTLWIDQSTGDLRELDFRYTGLDRLDGATGAGGRVEFERLPSGAWIVRRWWLRMPIMGVRGQRRELAGIREEGGEVVEVLARGVAERTPPLPPVAADRDLPLAELDRVRLFGQVVDWSTGEPVSNAAIELPDADRRTLTDPMGRFLFTRVPIGAHGVNVQHIAYGRYADSVLVRRDTELTVRLPRTVVTLDPVIVTAASERTRSARARGTRANILAREEIARALPRVSSFTQLLRVMSTPGLTVRDDVHYTDSGHRGVCIQAGRSSTSGDRCKMVEVYLNDIRLAQPEFQLDGLDPGSIEEIEFLPPLEAGSRYGTGAANGVLLIYIRRGGR